MSAVTMPSRNVTRSEPVSRIFARSLQSIIPARVRTARTSASTGPYPAGISQPASGRKIAPSKSWYDRNWSSCIDARTMVSAPFDVMRRSRRRRPGRKFHNGPRFGLRRMAPELRDGRISVFAKRIMRKPRTLHCPYCDGKVLFTRRSEHLDAKNCPRCGMRVERREWPEKLYDPMPILRTKPGGPDAMKIETPETKDEPAKKGEKAEKKD